MKNFFLSLKTLVVVLMCVGKATAQVPTCGTNVPFYSVNLVGSPAGTWISPSHSRLGQCCTSSGSDNCTSFTLLVDSMAAMVNFEIASGSVPSGAMYYQINCSAPVAVGSAICLTGPGPHHLTFCKPGNNTNTYKITSIPRPIFPKDDTIRGGCSKYLDVWGLDSASITWTSVYPGAAGAYNSYLNLSNKKHVLYTPAGTAPAYIDYKICGHPMASVCGLADICDTIRIYNVSALTATVNPNPSAFCAGGSGVVLTATASGGVAPYAYIWKDPSATVVGTTSTINATVAGNYTLEVRDTRYATSLCPGYIVTVPVTIASQPIVNAGPDQMRCKADPVTALNGSVTYATGGAWSGGAGTYSPGATSLITDYTPTAGELAAGFVNLILTSTGSGGGCVNKKDTVHISYTQEVASSAAGNIACNGGSTTVTVSATGGMTPYTGTGTFTVPAGSYTYTVTDAIGCTSNTSIIVNEPTLLTAASTSGNIACHGGTTAITTSAAGGTAPYSGTGTFTVPTGTYTYTITDAHGCTATTSKNIPEPTLLTASSSAGSTACFGGSATANVFASGGTAPYSGIGSYTVTAGTYTYTATDANGCTASTSVTVTEPALLSASSTAGNISCHGGTTTITVTGSGGSLPYSGTGTFTVTAGSHAYTVTDANGCTANTSKNVTEPSLLSASSTSGNIACNGGTTTITVTGAGGTLPYTGTGAFTVTAGTYTYTVTDAKGCTATTSITVTEPTLLNASSTSGSIACRGGTTSITVTGAGGTLPYTGTGAFTVSAGSYSYTVTDAKGCTANTSITVTQPTQLIAASTSGSIACNGGTTTIAVTGSGGTTPYSGTGTFTVAVGPHAYTVTDANGCTANTSITVIEPTLLTAASTSGAIACNGGTTTITATATGGVTPYSGIGTYTVTAGAYTYTVTDGNGCTATTSKNISEPTLLTASSAAGATACFGGSATVTVAASGGTAPYSGIGTFTVAAGSYSYTATDAHGCTASTSITVTQPTLLSASSTSGSIACRGGTTTVTVTGAGGTLPYSGAGTFTVTAGSYSYTVTDANGCTANTSIVVNQPTLLTAASTSGSIACNGGTTTVTVTGSGGTLPYSGTGTFTVTAGSHAYTVTDANGCTANTSINVTQPTLLTAASVSGNIACHGGTTTITATATGGTAPYSGTGTFIVPTGTYTYTVTDARGCTANTSQNISEPTLLTASSSAGATACFGGSATVNVAAAGGTAPYSGIGTYTVAAGSYTYTTTDANGCSASTSITVTEPALLSASSTSGNIACHGGTTTITVIGAGGTLPYSGIGTFTVTAGPHSYTVTDANGCTSNTSITVSEPTLLTSASTSGSIACNGGTTTITATATGGVTPYSGTGTFTVPAGAYTYTVTDANGCTTTTSQVISEPTLLTASSSAGATACFGGSATTNVFGSGGTAPYSGIGTYTVAAGSYSYTVTDANGCTANTSITVTEPALLSASSVSGSIACNGGTTTITVAGTGGTLPYSGTSTFTVPAGSYSYTVTDANGCTANTSIVVTEPTLLNAASTSGSIACNGGTTTIAATATGGVTPYSGIGTYTVPAGSYTYTVTDANGCTATTSQNISEPTLLTTSSSATAVACFGGSATVNVAAAGGTAPYSGIGTFTVAAGSYSYTATDANGCTAATSITVTEPTLLTASSTSGNIACHGETTTIIVAGSGGTLPYTGSGTFTVNAGSYPYTVTDANGCTANTSITVSQPTQLAVATSGTDASCNAGKNGTATATASGGTAPYSYQWDANAANQMTATATGLRVGDYKVVVTDNNGCQQTATVHVGGGASQVVLSPKVNGPNCFQGQNGTINMNVTGGVAPYTYLWSTGATTADINDLAAGTYSVVVTDKVGCSQTTTIEVSQPNPLSVSLLASQYAGGYNISRNGGHDGTIAASVKGGTAPYSYTWSDSHTTRDLQDLPAGDYKVTVSDIKGCTADAEITLTEPLPLVLPTGYSPNGDGHNDFFVIRGIEAYPNNTLVVFNRWGNEVWSGPTYLNTWNGQNKNNEKLPDGTYFVILTINGGEIMLNGYVDVRR